MDSEKIEKVLDRVRKLFSLAGNNPNEHEAASAAEMAKDLLDKYNLTISDIEMKEVVEKEITFNTYRQVSWKGWIARIVSETFDTLAYETKSKYTKTCKLVFIGSKPDVEVAMFVYQYLLTVIQRLIDKKIKEDTSGVHGKTVRYNYTMGIVSVLRDRLTTFYGKQREAHSEEKNAYGMTGKEIVVVKNDAIQKYLESIGMKLRNQSTSHNIMNQDAYSDGVEDGNNISLTKGIKGSQQSVGYLN